MSQSEHEALLGPHDVTYVTDTRRMVTTAIWGVIIGAVFTLFSVAVVVHLSAMPANSSSGGAGKFAGVLIAIALLLPLSVVRLVRALRRRGESYQVYENGFVYHATGRDEVVRWSQVAAVHEVGEAKSGGLLHALALDYRCRVRCTDGRRFTLNTYTDGAEWFFHAVDRHVRESRAAAS
jgi:hypothetical protein